MGSRKTRSISSGYSSGYRYANRKKIPQADREHLIINKLSIERESVTLIYQNDLSSFSSSLAKSAAKEYILYNYPIFRELYFAYKFSKYAYEFSIKVQSEYERNGGDLEDAIITVAASEKDRFIETAKEAMIDYAIRRMWNKFKEEEKIEVNNPVLDDLIQSAMSETIREMMAA